MDIFYIIIALILLLSLMGWVQTIRDMRNRPVQYRELDNKDIVYIKNVVENMEGREFEYFCSYLFKKTGKYKNVKLTPSINDEGKDIILTTENDEVIYVEAKRYTENATTTEEYMVGRVICQKIIGSMVSDNIKHGIIITTGNIHQNAWNYINKLEKNNPDMKLDILNMDDIVQMIRNNCDLKIYNELNCIKA